MCLLFLQQSQIEMSLHSDTLFRVNQSLLFLLNGTNTNFVVFSLADRGSNPHITKHKARYVNHYTKDVAFSFFFF